jgi:hypothetical protein
MICRHSYNAWEQLNKTNAVTISQFITEELARFFLLNVVPKNKILLMLSDAAPYMVKATSNIKFFYKKLIHCIVCSTKNSLAASHDKSEVCLSTRCEMNY